jgi:hypothetical protein
MVKDERKAEMRERRERKAEVRGRRERKRKQLLDDIKEK